MSAQQKLTLLNNVSATGPGTAMQWDGGKFVAIAWWDALYVVAVEFSPDGGSHWGVVSNNNPSEGRPFLNTLSGGKVAINGGNLPAGMLRGNISGSSPPPLNVNLVIQGDSEALEVNRVQ